MMKIASILIGLMAFTFSTMAQDVIIQKDGKRVEGQIQERTSEFVIIKGADGGSTAIPIGSIDRIEADKQNDQKNNTQSEGYDYSGEGSSESEPDNEEYTVNYGKNLVHFNLMEFGILLNLNLSYERILSDGYLGLKLGYGYGLESTTTEDIQSSIYNYTSRYNLDINIYPAGQHRASYFIGPSIMYGSFDREDPLNSDEVISNDFTSFLVNNGVVVSVTPNFGVTTKLGLGIVRELGDDEYKGIELAAPLFSFAMTLRF